MFAASTYELVYVPARLIGCGVLPMNFSIEYTVAGSSLRPEQVGRAIELSQTRYCSVSAMLGRVAALAYTWRIVERLEAG